MDVHRFKSSNQGSTCSQTVTMADTAGSSDMGEKKDHAWGKMYGRGSQVCENHYALAHNHMIAEERGFFGAVPPNLFFHGIFTVSTTIPPLATR